MIRVENLTRKYGTFTAVDRVSFEIGEGEIVGLLGHNGAGKTTIMKVLTGYLEPSGGSVLVDGHDVHDDRGAVQERMGYLPENCPLYTDMTVIEYLDYAAELHGVCEADRPAALKRAIEATELQEKITAPIRTLSRGYRQRVGVAQAILHSPKIIILDEPTNGLDPSQIKHMRSLITELAKSATVIISTHILQEVQAICSRVIIINRGEVALDSSLSDLQAERRLRVVSAGKKGDVEGALKKISGIEGVESLTDETHPDANTLVLKLNGAAVNDVAPKVARAVLDKGADLIALHTEERDLESVFAEISVSGAREEAVTND